MQMGQSGIMPTRVTNARQLGYDWAIDGNNEFVVCWR
jgi:hypothetical protein